MATSKTLASKTSSKNANLDQNTPKKTRTQAPMSHEEAGQRVAEARWGRGHADDSYHENYDEPYSYHGSSSYSDSSSYERMSQDEGDRWRSNYKDEDDLFHQWKDPLHGHRYYSSFTESYMESEDTGEDDEDSIEEATHKILSYNE